MYFYKGVEQPRLKWLRFGNKEIEKDDEIPRVANETGLMRGPNDVFITALPCRQTNVRTKHSSTSENCGSCVKNYSS